MTKNVPTYQKNSITLELANKLIAASEKKAHEIGVPMVTAIVDESGNLKALSRMDRAPLLANKIAQDKAYTAVGFGMPTEEWYPFIKDDPPLMVGAPHIDRIVVFGGGIPVQVNEEIVGGIGVSGGHYSQDIECAKEALKIIDA